MKKPKVPQGRKADGTPVRTASSEPIKRTLRNGMIRTAWSEAAEREMDPLAELNALVREWRQG